MADKRCYSRIKTRVKALLRRAEDKHSPPLFRTSIHDTPTIQSHLKDAGIPESLRLFMEYLDGKLDLILSILGKDIIEKEFEFSTVVVELSGGGLKCIRPSQDFQVGDTIEILLFLCHIPLRTVSAVGEVVRIEQLNSNEVLVVEFTHIRELDREEVVRFVFQEEREQIRIIKGD